MRFPWSRDSAGDAGFTLIEMVVTVAVLGVIAVPITEMITATVINTGTIHGRLDESKDQQISAQFWAQDVASMGTRASSTFSPGASINPGTDCAPYSGTKLLTLAWTRYSLAGASSAVQVTYSTSGSKLLRTSCASGAARTYTLATTVVPTSVQCSLDGTTWVACNSLTGAAVGAGSGGALSTTTGLSMRFTAQDPSLRGQPYTVLLTGQGRQS